MLDSSKLPGARGEDTEVAPGRSEVCWAEDRPSLSPRPSAFMAASPSHPGGLTPRPPYLPHKAGDSGYRRDGSPLPDPPVPCLPQKLPDGGLRRNSSLSPERIAHMTSLSALLRGNSHNLKALRAASVSRPETLNPGGRGSNLLRHPSAPIPQATEHGAEGSGLWRIPSLPTQEREGRAARGRGILPTQDLSLLGRQSSSPPGLGNLDGILAMYKAEAAAPTHVGGAL
jgi:hypothetical protein